MLKQQVLSTSKHADRDLKCYFVSIHDSIEEEDCIQGQETLEAKYLKSWLQQKIPMGTQNW